MDGKAGGLSWLTAAAAAQYESIPALLPDTAGKTLRGSLRLRLGGEAYRVVLGALYESRPVRYGRIAVKAGGVLTALRFSGQEDVVLRPGVMLASDPVEQPVKAGDTLTIWLYNAGQSGACSVCRLSQKHSGHGDFCGESFVAERFTPATPDGMPFVEQLGSVTGVEVLTAEAPRAIAAYGDSITAMELWTVPLQKRLGATPLFNLAVSGARLLKDTHFLPVPGVQIFGVSAQKRAAWDLFGRPGVHSAIFALGVNDISQPDGVLVPLDELCTAEALIDGMIRFIDDAHAHGMRIAGATITPFGGYPSWDPAREAMRRRVNAWILSAGAFDMTIDFAAAVCAPGEPERLLARCDSGDHLHPSPAGGRAMAACVDTAALCAL